MSELIKMQFGILREHVLHGDVDERTKGALLGMSGQLTSIVKHKILEVG